MASTIRIAVEGCAHGELDAIYASLELLQKKHDIKIDLLICCGDFQAIRNEDDLLSLACPPKYRAMNSYYKYYSGEKVAPITTLFIGGNHESSLHHHELFFGGWVAPNIYFLGCAGVVQFGGVRIGGMSGIYKDHDYPTGHYESPPFTDSSMRSAYHIRQFEVFQMKQLTPGKLDIFLSHDWPLGIARHGDLQSLYRRKSFLQPEIESNTLGSPPMADILALLQPTYWFSAHLHVKFAALVEHPACVSATTTSSSPAVQPRLTRFLALDKCLPNRDFLQMIELPNSDPACILGVSPKLCYDAEWLAILKRTNAVLPLQRHAPQPRGDYRPTAAELVWVMERLKSNCINGRIPENFVITVPPHNPRALKPHPQQPNGYQTNPQTTALLTLLDLPNRFVEPAAPTHTHSMTHVTSATTVVAQSFSFASNRGTEKNNSMYSLLSGFKNPTTTDQVPIVNPEEIDLDAAKPETESCACHNAEEISLE